MQPWLGPQAAQETPWSPQCPLSWFLLQIPITAQQPSGHVPGPQAQLPFEGCVPVFVQMQTPL